MLIGPRFLRSSASAPAKGRGLGHGGFLARRCQGDSARMNTEARDHRYYFERMTHAPGQRDEQRLHGCFTPQNGQ